ncbi:MAG: carbon-nitrogen hydrolase [Arenicellales bacterium]|nr:carbon-nitrogen hydrolase [Arenicellales bacterium]
MTHPITLAVTQMACSWDQQANLKNAERLVRQAAGQGAQVVLLQELFRTPYFPIEQCHKHRALAERFEQSDTVSRFATLAAELRVVLPISFFEKAGEVYFNTVAMADADGTVLGRYRKSHIPNDPGYQEKQFFSPGNSGLRVWDTAYGRIGVGICWDQWFPEVARCMALAGADMILYPTAIGSGLDGEDGTDSLDAWRNAMCGHAACNILPVAAANRIGREYTTEGRETFLDFYGNSFIADHKGVVAGQAGSDTEEVVLHTVDLTQVRNYRDSWAVFRDRRPDLYGAITTLDGAT